MYLNLSSRSLNQQGNDKGADGYVIATDSWSSQQETTIVKLHMHACHWPIMGHETCLLGACLGPRWVTYRPTC